MSPKNAGKNPNSKRKKQGGSRKRKKIPSNTVGVRSDKQGRQSVRQWATALKRSPKHSVLLDAYEVDPVNASGRELGFRAAIARDKSAVALLEFCGFVYAAYARFYEPWKAVGRKKGKRTAEAKAAEENWREFLTEMDWADFKRHQKQIRDLVAIGRKAQLLESRRLEIPRTVSALSTLCKLSADDDQLITVAHQCTPDITAAEVKKLFKMPGQTQTPRGSLKRQITLLLADEHVEANAAVLALIYALEMDGESLKSDARLAELDGEFPELVRRLTEYRESTQMKALVGFYDRRVNKSQAEASAAARTQLDRFRSYAGGKRERKVRDRIRGAGLKVVTESSEPFDVDEMLKYARAEDEH